MDASVSYDRQEATYAMVSSDGLEHSDVLELDEAVPSVHRVEWSETKAVCSALRILATDPDWTGVALEDTVVYSDNDLLSWKSSPVRTRVRRLLSGGKEAAAASFEGLAAEIWSSSIGFVGWLHIPDRDPVLSARVDRLAFCHRRPGFDPSQPRVRRLEPLAG